MTRRDIGRLLREVLTPRQPAVQFRRLLRVSVTVRWLGLAAAGIVGLVARPLWPEALVILLLVVAAYNGAAMIVVNRASDSGAVVASRMITLLDGIACFGFIGIYVNLPGGPQSAFYVPILIEAVAYDGTAGALQALVVFVAGTVGLQAVGAATHQWLFSWTVVLIWSIIMTVLAVSVAVADWATRQPLDSANRATTDAVREATVVLSPREQEVLRLIAAGYSNPMIAGRLHLSEATVKGYVENLRVRLNARSRAEAVAVASRLHLL